MKDELTKNRIKFLKIVGNVLIFASIFFIGRKIYLLHIDFGSYLTVEKMIKMVPIVLLFTVMIMLQFVPWMWIVWGMTSIKLSKITVAKTFLKSSIMRYLPGNVFQYVGRAELIAEDERLNFINIGSSVVLETFVTFMAAISIGLIGTREYTISLFKETKVLLIIVLLLILLVLCCATIFQRKASELLIKNHIYITAKLVWVLLASLGFFSATLMIQGYFLTEILSIISDESYVHELWIICGAYSIGWVAGYVTPGASGGIGIREAILCFLLGNFLPEEVIIVAVLILRLVNIISDLSAYIISELVYKIFGRNQV